MADVARLLRTLAPLPKHMLAARLVNEARKRAWRPVLPRLVRRWRQRGEALAARADDDAMRRLGRLLSAADRPDSQGLCDGRFVLAGRDAGVFPPRWPLAGCSPLQVYEAHYLDWLDALIAAGPEHFAVAQSALSQWQHHAATAPVCWEPYPRARRVLACLRAASRLPPEQLAFRAEILAAAAAAAVDLQWLLEHHLDGNHLLVDRLALAASAAVWGQPTGALQRCAAEFARQLDADGGHVEGSPMYHARLLEDALVVRALAGDEAAVLGGSCDRALRWLAAIRHPDGTLPCFGDTDPGTLTELSVVRHALAEPAWNRPNGRFLDGVATWACERADTHVVLHTAVPVWSVQAGHAHDDSLAIGLAVGGHTVIADAGLSGYEGDPDRPWNRSAAAHSTVEIPGFPALELWGAFRVGARGKVAVRWRGEVDGWRVCAAEHTWPDGQHAHRRLVAIDGDGTVVIADAVTGGSPAVGRLRLHEDVSVESVAGGVALRCGQQTGADASETAPAGSVRNVLSAAALSVTRDRRFPRLGVRAECWVLSYRVGSEPVWLAVTPARDWDGPNDVLKACFKRSFGS